MEGLDLFEQLEEEERESPEPYLWALSLHPDQLPPDPFELNAWTSVHNGAGFLSHLQSECQFALAYLRGERLMPHPRQRTGALQETIALVRELLRRADDEF